MRSGWYMGNLFLSLKKISSREELRYKPRVLYEIRLVYGKPFHSIKKMSSRIELPYQPRVLYEIRLVYEKPFPIIETNLE